MIHKYKMNGHNIVLDVNGGSVHVFDDVSYDILDYFEKYTKEEIADLLPQYPKASIEEAYDEIESMKKENLLFCDDRYLQDIPLTNREPIVKAMCLNIVHNCNLKCKYCFASQGDFGGHKAYMTEEVGKKALHYLVTHSGKRHNLEVDFFGGEPLMNFSLVKKLIHYGDELAKIHDKKFHWTITTNGVLLNDEMIAFINEHMHNVVLSLDGRREINDAMRPTLNDRSSYDIIVPKFQQLIRDRADKEYYVRGTFTKQNLDFSKDVAHFKELGFLNSSIEPVVDPEYDDYAITYDDLDRVLEEYETFAASYAKDKCQGDPFNFFHFMVDLSQGPCVIKRMQGCGAGCEYLAITPEGDIYPCHQFVGKEEFIMGNVLDDHLELPKKIQEDFLSCNVLTKPMCQTCWNKFYCSGGCHANALNFNHDLQKPYELGCEMQKKRTECAIMIEVEKMLHE